MPPRKTHSPLTRERFMTAAWDFIERHGFDALTMRSLGRAMGVSASAVYTYFPEREQLVASSPVESEAGGLLAARLIAALE
jgi:TetR/AcrR family tetracycline transcriptional repressor